MFCPECGAKNEDGSLFCCECGTPLKSNTMNVQPASGAEKTVQNGAGMAPAGMNQEGGFQMQGVPQMQRGPQPGYPQGASVPFRPAKPPRQKKPVSKAVIAVIVEAVAAVGLIAGTCKVIGDKCSPETVAEAYWKASAACQWADAYEYCDFPESEFLTGQMYVNAKANHVEPLTYKSMRVVDQGAAAMEAMKQMGGKLSDLGDLFGADVNGMMDQAKDKSAATDARNFAVEYLTKGSAEKEYTYLAVTRTGKKQFLFWDEWKVSSSDNWAQNVQFTIPAAAEMKLNGVTVPEKAAQFSDDQTRKTITMPYLFTGEYQMEVTEDGMEPYRKVIEMNSWGCEDDYIQLRPSQETIQQLTERAGDDVKAIMDSALAGKDFSEISSLLSKQAVEEYNAQGDYEELKELKGDGRDSGIITLSMKNMKVAQSGDVSEKYIYLRLTTDVQTTYYQYWSDTPGHDSTTMELEITYTKDADGWKLAELPVSYYNF